MIDFCEAEILKWHVPEATERGVHVDCSAAHLFEKRAKLILIHEARISAR